DRPSGLAEPGVTIEQVMQYALAAAERENDVFDAAIFANYLYAFRPGDFFDELIVRFARSGVDSVVPTLNDYQCCWVDHGGRLDRVDSGFRPREMRSPLQRGFVGLGCITSTEFIREGRLLGDSIDLIPFGDPWYSLKAGDRFGDAIVRQAFEQGVELFGPAMLDESAAQAAKGP
ncbi:MAG: hypothetical protein Q7R41_11980, partial [Phycisphaerales bacterium]|nr:hypothetical protein [Phycisphaerales bacterium]